MNNLIHFPHLGGNRTVSLFVSILVTAVIVGVATYSFQRSLNKNQEANLYNQISTLQNELSALQQDQAALHACWENSLRAELEPGTGANTAGTQYYNLVFFDTASEYCTFSGLSSIDSLNSKTSELVGTSVPPNPSTINFNIDLNPGAIIAYVPIGFANPANFPLGTCKSVDSLMIHLTNGKLIPVTNISQYGSYTSNYCQSLDIGSFTTMATP